MPSINPIRDVNPIAGPGAVGTGGKPGDFAKFLNSAINSVEQARGAAGVAVDRLISGEGEEMHTTALAVQRAELSLEMFVQVRNKVVQAYQEVMRMQI
jgi:flagellar hook-basal body complex protein FliE